MTIDKTLRIKRGSGGVRNVLKRGERLEKLKEAERWKDGSSILGLPKVRVAKLSLKKKKKEKKEEGEADTKKGGKGAAKPAAGAKPAAAAKPAAGAAKPAAGAAKPAAKK